MKAVVWTKYGPPEVLQLRELEKPTPKANELLVRIVATTVTAGDCELRSLKLPFYISLPMRLWLGVIKPRGNKIPGTEFAGVIEAIGEEVRSFKEGDHLFGSTGLAFGTNAEYVALSEDPEEGVVALKPANMTFEEAATVPFGGLDALHFLKKGDIQPGQKVLINGAGGSIGTFGVQLAKHFGAEVIAVDSAGKLDMLLALGADRVIDYTLEDFTKSDELYDVIFDVVGKSSFSPAVASLKEKGVYLLANPRLSHMLRGMWTSTTSSKKVIFEAAGHKLEDLLFLRELIESGKIKTVIDRRYTLEQVTEAHRYVETGQKLGNVVITVAQQQEADSNGER